MAGAFGEVAALDNLWSAYRKESLVSKINAEAFEKPIPLDGRTRGLIQRALYFNKLSDGAFDITVGPLVDYWRGLDKRDEAPSPAALQDVLKRVGSARLRLDEKDSIRFSAAGMKIVLGGIAKGYAADVIVDYLKKKGVAHGLVNIGGDMTVFGGRSAGTPWRVGIQNPFEKEEFAGIIEISDGSVVTSGNYERYYFIRGKRYSHIIDPATGMPADALPSVTVIAPTGTDADAIATAISVMGRIKGMALVEQLEHTECALITGDATSHTMVTSSGFGRFLDR
jgi:thiamine biosynthesis lipoprotein